MPDFSVRADFMPETVQLLMQMKSHARSIQNSADSLMPMANDNTLADLKLARECAEKIEVVMGAIYTRNAKAAFGEPQPAEAGPQRA